MGKFMAQPYFRRPLVITLNIYASLGFIWIKFNRGITSFVGRAVFILNCITVFRKRLITFIGFHDCNSFVTIH